MGHPIPIVSAILPISHAAVKGVFQNVKRVFQARAHIFATSSSGISPYLRRFAKRFAPGSPDYVVKSRRTFILRQLGIASPSSQAYSMSSATPVNTARARSSPEAEGPLPAVMSYRGPA